MRRILCTLSVLAFACPIAGAEEASITRRDGFLLLWDAIHRATYETREVPFTDIAEGDRGFAVIRYAKARGLVEDVASFSPDEPLFLEDALLWLFRTRNVDANATITRENLPMFAERYPLGDVWVGERGARTIADRSVSESELTALIRTLDQLLIDEVHEASLYAEKFHGKGTAYGETFDMFAMTAAHKNLPHNTLVKVTNLANGKSVVVRINDRGPFVPGRDMDLSLAAFTAISPRGAGKIRATFERLGDATLVGTSSSASSTPMLTSSSSSTSSVASAKSTSSCAQESSLQTRVIGSLRLMHGLPRRLELGDTVLLRARTSFSVYTIRIPNGTQTDVDRIMQPHEEYRFTPDAAGRYRFLLGIPGGRSRWMTMNVVECA